MAGSLRPMVGRDDENRDVAVRSRAMQTPRVDH
jgi:hypothetical protein